MKKHTLDTLKIGKSAIIDSLTSNNIERRRMLDFGFVPNAQITALYRSPFNNPTAYLIKGTIIALRNEDAKKVIIKKGD